MSEQFATKDYDGLFQYLADQITSDNLNLQKFLRMEKWTDYTKRQVLEYLAEDLYCQCQDNEQGSDQHRIGEGAVVVRYSKPNDDQEFTHVYRYVCSRLELAAYVHDGYEHEVLLEGSAQ